LGDGSCKIGIKAEVECDCDTITGCYRRNLMFDITKESHPGNGSWRSFLEECLFIKCEFIVTMSEKEVYASMCTWKERLEICLHCEGILVSFKNNPSPGNMSQ